MGTVLSLTSTLCFTAATFPFPSSACQVTTVSPAEYVDGASFVSTTDAQLS